MTAAFEVSPDDPQQVAEAIARAAAGAVVHLVPDGRCRRLGLRPSREPLIETLARAPYVVLANLGTADAAAMDTRQQAAGVFDPLASWVVHACRQRGWPAVSTDPGRLRRIDPDLPIDVL